MSFRLQPHSPRHKDRGAALLLALFVVSLVSAIAVNMTGEYLIDIKYQRNYLDEEQAYFYLLSAEAKAMRVLFADAEGDKIRAQNGVPRPYRDNLCESWRAPIRYSIPGGTVQISLKDENSKLNLNRLIRQQGQPVGGNFPYTPEQKIFVRLLQTFDHLEIDAVQAVEIAEAVYDWMDANTEVQGFGGMEDAEYSGEGYAYRTANSSMASVSELRLIPKISSELYKALRRHVTVWPTYGRLGKHSNHSVMNINTVSANILRALPNVQGLEPVDPEAIVPVLQTQQMSWDESQGSNAFNFRRNAGGAATQQEQAGYSESANCGFRHMSNFNAMVAGGADNPFIGLESQQIIVDSQITIGQTRRKMQTLIHRIRYSGEMEVWARAFGSL